MKTTTITVKGEVGQGVWWLDERTIATYDDNGDQHLEIIADYEIKKTVIKGISTTVTKSGVDTVYMCSTGPKIYGHPCMMTHNKIYLTKSGARRARLRLLKQAKEKYSQMIWGGVE